MNKTLVVLSVLAAGAFLIPDVAEAQRGGRGGGGARMGTGGFGGGARMGGGGFRGGSFGAGPRMYIPRGGVGGPRVGLNAWRGRGVAIAARPGWGGVYAPRAIYRGGYGRYGWRAPYYGRVTGAYRPYYRGYYGRGWRYPYYGGAVAAGLISGLALGALSYPYPYGYGYPYDYGYYGESEPYVASAQWPPCMQGPPLCTAAGYPNLSYLRRAQGAPF
jgi:hypothetical protein